MKKYIFYIKLLLFIVSRLKFSIDIVKEFCLRRISKNPKEYHARFLLAELCRSEGSNIDAIEEYKKLMEFGFNNAKIMYGLAMASFKEHRYIESQKYFKKVLETNLNDKVALDHLGRINTIKKRYREAIGYFEKSLKLDPNDALILENIAYCYYNIEDYAKAYEAYRIAFKFNPSSELKKNISSAKKALKQ